MDIPDGAVIEWLQGIGFPAWAIVVYIIGNKIVAQIQQLAEQHRDIKQTLNLIVSHLGNIGRDNENLRR